MLLWLFWITHVFRICYNSVLDNTVRIYTSKKWRNNMAVVKLVCQNAWKYNLHDRIMLYVGYICHIHVYTNYNLTFMWAFKFYLHIMMYRIALYKQKRPLKHYLQSNKKGLVTLIEKHRTLHLYIYIYIYIYIYSKPLCMNVTNWAIWLCKIYPLTAQFSSLCHVIKSKENSMHGPLFVIGI